MNWAYKTAGWLYDPSEAGNWLEDCCCPDGCGICDPPLDYTYTVSFSGLQGEFAGQLCSTGEHLKPFSFNGSHVVPFFQSFGDFCVYREPAAGDPHIYMSGRGGGYNRWEVILITQPGCYVFFERNVSDMCDGPAGTYTMYSCSYSGCTPGFQCTCPPTAPTPTCMVS